MRPTTSLQSCSSAKEIVFRSAHFAEADGEQTVGTLSRPSAVWSIHQACYFKKIGGTLMSNFCRRVKVHYKFTNGFFHGSHKVLPALMSAR